MRDWHHRKPSEPPGREVKKHWKDLTNKEASSKISMLTQSMSHRWKNSHTRQVAKLWSDSQRTWCTVPSAWLSTTRLSRDVEVTGSVSAESVPYVSTNGALNASSSGVHGGTAFHSSTCASSSTNTHPTIGLGTWCSSLLDHSSASYH
jgi:hypothetical protein